MHMFINVINEFNKHDIQYVIFKEFDLLDKAFNGLEDIDLLICEDNKHVAYNIMKKAGYKKCLWPKPLDGICFFIGYNVENGSKSLLHVHTKLRIGSKQAKEYHWVNLEKKILSDFIVEKYGTHVINPNDELLLLFVRMILRKKPNSDDYSRLSQLSNLCDINQLVGDDNPIQDICGEIDLDKYCNSDFFGSDLERKKLKNYLLSASPSRISVFCRRMWAYCHRFLRGVRRLIKAPAEPINRFGRTYAIVGVDGSGKTTTICNIVNDNYMRSIGCHRIYCGYNEYWMPGLQKAVSRKHGIITNFFCLIDKRFRVFGAFVFSILGVNVLYDRYFYDDKASYYKSKNNGAPPKKLLFKKIFHGWIGVRPRKTFYLRVPAEIAYERKRDYDFDELCKNIYCLEKVLQKEQNIVIIDASKCEEDVYREIIKNISLD